MLLNQLRFLQTRIKYNATFCQYNHFSFCNVPLQNVKTQEMPSKIDGDDITVTTSNTLQNILTTARVVPLTIQKEPVVLSFDEVPGPKTLKYLSSARNYVSQIGTQITARALTLGLGLNGLLNNKKPRTALTALFEEYGPVVRFVSPLGSDIVLINHPDHIQKVFTMEGDYPVRSTLDSLEKYRTEHRNHLYGIFAAHGQEWAQQRAMVGAPLHSTVSHSLMSINDICEVFIQKLYTSRNYQDEVKTDMYKELHKWAFDCMGLIIFAKKFSMIETELVYSQCDMSWLYHSLERATDAILKCESGLRLWKLFPTPTWYSLVKYCDSMDSLIGKHVLEAEQTVALLNKESESFNKGRMDSLIASMLTGDHRMTPEDISTVLMDMLLIGVNTIASTMSFLLFYLAKYQKAQRILLQEVDKMVVDNIDVKTMKNETPYLQACIKETLRLVPPIPIITRILPKNITLDKFNIPRGTLIIISTQDASQKESNFDDAEKFYPERWLKPEWQEYHAFASIPFGFGARKCLGQNIAETTMSMLAIRIMQKYKLEYHYGDIAPTKEFIAKPNRPLKIRFIDRT